ncbi:NACHT domain-containing protein [Paenibacillus soyae]|uniref:NACHT domain-containing protein n=1 Tax=Paenibacillus soyae TaxID=2969249 RepID=A0A9X2MS76_9BACL|nr:hypothetical protein [Paenibacillus soyae]MCR2805410.1 hypothetical protein [Paenibacillus soyae]
MSDYSFIRFNSRDFEHMIQSLTKSIFGNGSIIFGDGPDGGREATFDGECRFPSDTNRWSGYWIIQAKFKNKTDNDNDYLWVKSQFEKEMKGFEERLKKGFKAPNNYIFFTNVNLTGVLESGSRDKMNKLIEKYNYLIKNILIFGESDICRFLDNNRDVAVTYSSFILPGDVLSSLHHLLNKTKTEESALIKRYLAKEFKGDLVSRLEHAGNVTDKTINLEKVFVDLYATKDGLIESNEKKRGQKFLKSIIRAGDESQRDHNNDLQDIENNQMNNKFVIIGGPGYGKSTITQFLCQIYRANILRTDNNKNATSEVDSFMSDCLELDIDLPKCNRFPIKIVLKDYAGWMASKTIAESTSVISYIQHIIQRKGDGKIDIESIRDLLSSMSFLFIFDGLDEVPVTSNRREVIEEINLFIDFELEQKNCDAIIIATTRPQGYTKEFDQSRYNHLQLTDLTKEDCTIYMNRLLTMMESSTDKFDMYLTILNKALNDEVISNLMKTPLQVTIMAFLVKSGGEPPRDRYNLFNEYYRTIFKREMQKSVVRVLMDYPKEVDAIHNELGYTLQANAEGKVAPSSSMTIEDFHHIVRMHLTKLELEEVIIDTYIDEISFTIIERMIFITEVEDGKVGFSIRSLQEFFAAQYLMHNRRERQIVDSLRAMSGSTYWRNTFLFCLGYLYRHKDFLIDYIDSLCSELNGSGEDLDKTSGKSIMKIGSWLSLDILNEGTFKGVPKYENKFIRHLEPLFNISDIELHSNIGYLPLDIKRRLLKFIEKYIESKEYTTIQTTLTIAGHLLKHNFSEIEDLIDRSFSKNADYELYNRYREIGLQNNKWYIKKFIEMMKVKNLRLLPLQFRNVEFMECLLKYDPSNLTKGIVLENLILINFQRYRRNEEAIRNLINLIDENISLVDDGIINKTLIKIKLANNIQLELVGINRSSANSLRISMLCKKYNLRTMKSLFDYLNCPNKFSLGEFIVNLGSEDAEFLEAMKGIYSQINWMTGMILFDQSDLTKKLYSDIINGSYGDIDKWESVEQLIQNRHITLKELLSIFSFKFISSNSNLITTTIESKLNDLIEFYEYYKEVKKIIKELDNSNLKEELIFNTFFALEGDLDNVKEYLLNNKDLFYDFISALNETKKDEFNFILPSLWYYLFGFFTANELYLFITSGEISLSNVQPFDVLFIPLSSHSLIENVFEKVVQLNFILPQNYHIIRMLYALCGSMTRDKSVLNLKRINYSYLHNNKFEDQIDDTCRVLLCFTDMNIEEKLAEDLLKELFKTAYNNPRVLLELLGVINGYWADDSKKEDLVVAVYNWIVEYLTSNEVDIIKIKKDYENTLLNLCHGYPSNIKMLY